MPQKPFKREQPRPRRKPFMAYDLETTRIKKGTPDPLYITVHGETYNLSMPIKGKDKYDILCSILETHLLTPDKNNTRFIAWNGNNYDAYFIAQSLLRSKKWILRPYLTRTKSLRGIKVVSKDKCAELGGKKLQFEFLDGMSMTGLAGVSLKKFVEKFASQYPKLDLDLDKVDFDYNNKHHVAYAERDSEALYHGLVECNRIVHELTGCDLQPTIGNLAIKYFQSQLPEDVLVWHPPFELNDILHGPLKRGGYCWVQQQFQGKVWKYDLNQAYAAAMRDCKLPSGRCIHTRQFVPDKCGVYLVYVGRGAESLIPFYYRTRDRNVGCFTSGAFVETWLTNIEIEHLCRDGWLVDILEGFYWSDSFNMKDMVDKLEHLRVNAEGGPNGPLGTVVKMLGNNAYGKTLEQLEGIELVLAAERPDGYLSYMAENPDMDNVFFRMTQAFSRTYHQPQIGCFITAHVRLLVRDAALKEAETFLYADTDCVVFSKPVQHLDVDAKRYGAWKQEADGIDYVIIGKKIYCEVEGDTKKAKGLNIKSLTKEDFHLWMKGTPPKQHQIQKQNFVKFIGGQSMFNEMERSGTDVTLSQQAMLIGSRFVPISQ